MQFKRKAFLNWFTKIEFLVISRRMYCNKGWFSTIQSAILQLFVLWINYLIMVFFSFLGADIFSQEVRELDNLTTESEINDLDVESSATFDGYLNRVRIICRLNFLKNRIIFKTEIQFFVLLFRTSTNQLVLILLFF